MPENLLVLGGSGLVGSYFVDNVQDLFTISAPSSSDVNVLKLDQVERYLDRSQPSSILYSIGYTNVDRAEEEKDLAEDLNVNGIRAICKVAANLKVPVYYYSTDFVFDGKSVDRPYLETDSPHPLSFYGQTKHEGEEVTMAASSKNGVIRLTMPYAPRFDPKLDIARAMLRKLQDGQSITAVTDQKINPLYIMDVVSATTEIIKAKQSGIWHIGAPNFVTPWQFARELADAFDLNNQLIQKVTFEDYSKGRPAKRPQYSWIDPTKFIKQFGPNILHPTEQGLKSLARVLTS